MKKFTIRIEIHGNEENKMRQIENDLLSQGFKKTISADGGNVFRLPPNEYSYEGLVDRKYVLDKVQACASHISNDYSILITESRGRAWYNLSQE